MRLGQAAMLQAATFPESQRGLGEAEPVCFAGHAADRLLCHRTGNPLLLLRDLQPAEKE
jgi:hypothetical protein